MQSAPELDFESKRSRTLQFAGRAAMIILLLWIMPATIQDQVRTGSVVCLILVAGGVLERWKRPQFPA